MAAYLTLSDDDVRTIASSHGLGEVTAPPEPIETGYNNSIFTLHASTGDYVLKVYEPSIDPFVVTSLQERHDFQRFCFEHGIAVPDLVGPVGDYQGKPFEVSHKIEGIHPEHLNAGEAYEVGRLLATFHKKASEYPPFSSIHPPSSLKLLGGEIMGVVRRTAGGSNIGREMDYASTLSGAILEKMIKQFSLPVYNLPRGKIHGDLNDENILRDPKGRFHLLDMERVNEGPLISDISQGIVRLCNIAHSGEEKAASPKQQLNKGMVQQFLNGYQSVRPLTRDEVNVLPHSIYAQSRFYELASKKLGLVGRQMPEIIDPRRLKLELRHYDFYEMTGNAPAGGMQAAPGLG